MLTILGRASSINVRKVLFTCAELGIDYELEEWGAGELSLDDPAFLALNPNARVPVIRDGDFVLFESNAICRYLAAREGDGNLLPADPRQRALVEQWMDWQATELDNAWRYAFMALVRKSDRHADAAAIDASVSEWNRHMAMVDDALSRTGSWLRPDGFTLADIVVGLITHRWFMTPMERDPLPAVEAYYERLSERPGFQRFGVDGGP